MKMKRRSFLKACGIITGYAVLSVNIASEAFAAAMSFVALRQKSVYATDANPKIYKFRKSQNNPMITKIYNKDSGFLHDGPCGHKSHELLHTEYIDRSAKLSALKAKGYKLNF